MWTERYRPSNIDDYVGNEHIISKVRTYINNGDVPHLLLYGPAGTGKTTLAKIIANSTKSDLMYINASDENGVDTIRDKVKGYASTVGFSSMKVVILDESDFLTAAGQSILRNLMETFSKTTRFILTCNYVEKIIDPIQSRCQSFLVEPPSKKDVAKRLKYILEQENVSFQPSDLVPLVNDSYPDIRRIINSAQRNVVDGVMKIDNISNLRANYITDILNVLRDKSLSSNYKFTHIRKIIADAKVKDFTSLYTELYNNVNSISNSEKGVSQIILDIADAQHKEAFVVDREINVMAMFINILKSI